MYCFASSHVGVVVVCRLLSFDGSSPKARVCGDCRIVGGLVCQEAFVIDVSFPYCVDDDLCLCYCVFG